MKRCPQCNRVETDEALKFCRVDGVTLVNDSSSIGNEAGTAQLSESPASEVHTSILPHRTDTNINRATAPTTVLPAPPAAATGALAGARKRKTAIIVAVIVTAVFAVSAAFVANSYLAKRSSATIKSIAVLPLENRSGSSDADYLSDGLADSLIYRLSQLPNLTVSPTSSVMRYKGKAADVSAIAKELQVDAVMSGRLMQRGDDLSISVQLIDSRSNKLIWAEQYERKMSDLLTTQREIATSIAQKLELKLAGDEAKGITKKYTSSNEAYQLYLKGRYHYAKRTRDDLQKAVDYFQQAVELDPNFALAYALIADTYATMPAYPYLAPKDAFPRAKMAANRAVQIDPALAEAHSALGYSLAIYDWNWTEAEREFRRALELDDKNSLAHLRLGLCYYLPNGRTDDAIREIQRALDLEPLNLVNNANITFTYMYAGRNAEALAQGRKTYDLDPGFVLGRYQQGLAYVANGMYQEAIALAEKALQSDPNNQTMLQVAGVAYAKSGRKDDANKIISRFKEIGRTQYVMSFFVVTIYAQLGEADKAFAEMEVGYQQHDWRMATVLKTEPLIESLRSDARYKEMLKRLNLPE